MKKLIYFLTFVLLASLTLGTGFPQIISGTVTMSGFPVPEGLSLTQTNLETGDEVHSVVDSNGYFLGTWNDKFRDGDRIEISIDLCSSRPECKKVINLYDGVPVQVQFEIVGEAKEEIAEATYIYVCWDESQVASASQCPAIPKLICWDDSEVTNADDCPEEPGDLWKLILGGLLTAGVGGLGSFFVFKNRAMVKGVGIKIYKGNDGSEKVLHKHPGIRGYHLPSISHRDLYERHRKGQLNPKYEKDEDGKYCYVN